jgi:hypothetical protein
MASDRNIVMLMDVAPIRISPTDMKISPSQYEHPDRHCPGFRNLTGYPDHGIHPDVLSQAWPVTGMSSC